MGRRAKKAPVVTKKRPTLAKRFKCPFCANEAVVECKMDFKQAIGSLSCRLCAASYQMPIHHLHEPVDVFSEWLDDCEAAAKGGATGGPDEGAVPRYPDEDDEDEDDDDDDIPEAAVFNSRKDDRKRPAQASAASNKKRKPDDERATSYTDLGLDDSDSDSDED